MYIRKYTLKQCGWLEDDDDASEEDDCIVGQGQKLTIDANFRQKLTVICHAYTYVGRDT